MMEEVGLLVWQFNHNLKLEVIKQHLQEQLLQPNNLNNQRQLKLKLAVVELQQHPIFLKLRL